jgi:hypothetical protein
MITSGMFDPGTGQRVDGAMAPTRAEHDWQPGPVESEDPHDEPYGDLDLGPLPPNIMRDDAGDGSDDDGEEDCLRGVTGTVAPGPFSRSRQGR